MNNLAIQCCVAEQKHPQCIPLSVRPTDPFYSEFGTTCINVVRAALCPTCKLGKNRHEIYNIFFFCGCCSNDCNRMHENNFICVSPSSPQSKVAIGFISYFIMYAYSLKIQMQSKPLFTSTILFLTKIL